MSDPRPALRSGAVGPIDWTKHTMNGSLLPYLEMKVHHLVQKYDWGRIDVVGEYDRSCIVSDNEKDDKLFNWHRPTAEAIGQDLIIKCYPGADYVYHYALILATYLAIVGRYRRQVYCDLPPESVCDTAINELVVDVGFSEVVITGWGLPNIAGDDGWTAGHGYSWKKGKIGDNDVLYLGFLHSIWGDVAGRVVSRLSALGARRTVYVGKVGSLYPWVRPNLVLASGNCSVMGERHIRWPDFFEGSTAMDHNVLLGSHVT